MRSKIEREKAAVVEGRAPVECIEANMKFLGAQARALKGAMANAYPGTRAVRTETMAARV